MMANYEPRIPWLHKVRSDLGHMTRIDRRNKTQFDGGYWYRLECDNSTVYDRCVQSCYSLFGFEDHRGLNQREWSVIPNKNYIYFQYRDHMEQVIVMAKLLAD